MDAGRPIDARKILVHQHAQNFRLGVARHVGDFVDIKRAAMGLLQRPGFARTPVPGLDAEKFGLHGLGGDGRRVDHHKRPAARADASWMARAANSLPTPGAPVIKMRELAGATRSINCRNCCQGGGMADQRVGPPSAP